MEERVKDLLETLAKGEHKISLFLSLGTIILPTLIGVLTSLAFMPGAHAALLYLLAFVTVLQVAFAFAIYSLPIGNVKLALSLQSEVESAKQKSVEMESAKTLSMSLSRAIGSGNAIAEFILSSTTRAPSGLDQSTKADCSKVASFIHQDLWWVSSISRDNAKYRVDIYLKNESGDLVWFTGVRDDVTIDGQPSSSPGGRRWPVGSMSYAQACLVNAGNLITADLKRHDFGGLIDYSDEDSRKYRGIACAPIEVDGSPFGVLIITCSEPDQIDREMFEPILDMYRFHLSSLLTYQVQSGYGGKPQSVQSQSAENEGDSGCNPQPH